MRRDTPLRRQPRSPLRRRLALAVCAATVAAAPGVSAEEYDPWPGIAKEAFAGKAIADDNAVTLEAPVRAEDAALVPITMRVSGPMAAQARSVTLIVDKNPMPVVAKFTFGPAAGDGERVISTRVRIDMYSHVRAVLETADGTLHQTVKFVKAAGGCSAPALKDADEALASVGKTQVRVFERGTATAPEAQVMIRHPNYSGMQMNQLTGLYIPAKYVRELEVKRGDDVVFRMEGGISISEDPNIRFTYAATGSGADDIISVTAKDTEGSVFTGKSGQKGS